MFSADVGLEELAAEDDGGSVDGLGPLGLPFLPFLPPLFVDPLPFEEFALSGANATNG